MADLQSRWEEIGTSMSGKIAYRCRCCKRVSVTPDKRCDTFDRKPGQCDCTVWSPAVPGCNRYGVVFVEAYGRTRAVDRPTMARLHRVYTSAKRLESLRKGKTDG